MTDRVLPAPVMVPHWGMHGAGFLGGVIPAGTEDEDGRARILNEPARVRVRVFESRSNRLVAATISASDGSWRIDSLALDVAYRVVGVDPARQVNSAIQDWVYAAPMEP